MLTKKNEINLSSFTICLENFKDLQVSRTMVSGNMNNLKAGKCFSIRSFITASVEL